MIDIIGVSEMVDHESPRIKPGSNADITAAQAELATWAAPSPAARSIASRIIGHLGAAKIGARPNAVVRALLIDEVRRLRQEVNVPH